MHPALLVIDLQYWFFKISFFSTPEGKEKLEKLIDGTNELITFFKKKELPIIHILTINKADGSTRDLWAQRNDSWPLMEGTEDVKELAEIHTFDTDIQIIKTRSSSYLRTDLEETLKKLKVDTLVISGYSTNKCIGMASIESVERDFDVLLSGDAILGPDQRKVNAMLTVIQEGYGVFPISNQAIMDQIAKGIKS